MANLFVAWSEMYGKTYAGSLQVGGWVRQHGGQVVHRGSALVGCRICGLAGWLGGQLVIWLAGGRAGGPVGQRAGEMAGWVDSWLADWVAGYVAGCLAGWLAGSMLPYCTRNWALTNSLKHKNTNTDTNTHSQTCSNLHVYAHTHA